MVILFFELFGNKNDKVFYFKDRRIKFEQAPEPSDVYWENCGYPDNERYKQIAKVSILNIILLIIALIVFLILQYLQ